MKVIAITTIHHPGGVVLPGQEVDLEDGEDLIRRKVAKAVPAEPTPAEARATAKAEKDAENKEHDAEKRERGR